MISPLKLPLDVCYKIRDRESVALTFFKNNLTLLSVRVWMYPAPTTNVKFILWENKIKWYHNQPCNDIDYKFHFTEQYNTKLTVRGIMGHTRLIVLAIQSRKSK